MNRHTIIEPNPWNDESSANIINIHTARPHRADFVDTRTFAEMHQVDPDEAYREIVYSEVRDALIWLGLGAAAGSIATVVSAWVIGMLVL